MKPVVVAKILQAALRISWSFSSANVKYEQHGRTAYLTLVWRLIQQIMCVKRQWSGPDTIEFHILPQATNGKGTQKIKTASSKTA